MWKVTHHEKSCSAFEKNYGAADTKALSTTAIFRLLLYDSVCECLCKHFFLCAAKRPRARTFYLFCESPAKGMSCTAARALVDLFTSNKRARARPLFFVHLSPLDCTRARERARFLPASTDPCAGRVKVTLVLYIRPPISFMPLFPRT
jgi:hypothetical protein